MRPLILIVAALASLAACRTRPVELTGPEPIPDLSFPDFTVPPDFAPPADLTVPFVCRNVYVVDSNGTVFAFDTDARMFIHAIDLHCEPGAQNANSMSISRDGFAYLNYADGNLFRADLRTGGCIKTAFNPDPNGFKTFGMGFVADFAGAGTDTLYIASTSMPQQLGVIDFPAFTARTVAPINGNPELTGTADGQLWGFFPDAVNPRIAQIDRQTGAESNEIALPKLAGTPSAWAFAFWGGSFWVFLQRSSTPTGPGDASTVVYRVDRATGFEETVIPNSGHNTVGAGVSACAPTGLDH
jgi:hypothetical protein